MRAWFHPIALLSSAVLLGAAAAVLLGALDACGASSGATQTAIDTAYAEQTAACEADASTRAAARACRARVKKSFGLDASALLDEAGGRP